MTENQKLRAELRRQQAELSRLRGLSAPRQKEEVYVFAKNRHRESRGGMEG
jgi:hypothetical protein